MRINTINQKHIVEFDQGKFDHWCVYLQREGKQRYAPVDEEYFAFFKNLASKYGAAKVYNDFVAVYNVTNGKHEESVIRLIRSLSASYGADAEDVEIWFSIIYGGMIAEENKTGMVLKKRMKRLGMHKILLEGYEPRVAAKFSFGKKWRELNILMKERGFGI